MRLDAGIRQVAKKFREKAAELNQLADKLESTLADLPSLAGMNILPQAQVDHTARYLAQWDHANDTKVWSALGEKFSVTDVMRVVLPMGYGEGTARKIVGYWLCYGIVQIDTPAAGRRPAIYRKPITQTDTTAAQDHEAPRKS